MEFQKELEKFSQEILPQITQIQNSFMKKLAALEKSCIENAGDSDEYFVNCMTSH